MPAWINNFIPYKVWVKLFIHSQTSTEVWEWIIDFIPHIEMGVITYPCWVSIYLSNANKINMACKLISMTKGQLQQLKPPTNVNATWHEVHVFMGHDNSSQIMCGVAYCVMDLL